MTNTPPDLSGSLSVTVAGNELRAIHLAASKETHAKYNLRGVLVRPSKDGKSTIIEATNGKCAARLTLPLGPTDKPLKYVFLVPSHIVERLRDEDECVLTSTIGDRDFLDIGSHDDVSTAEGRFKFPKLVVGGFPDTDRIMPKRDRVAASRFVAQPPGIMLAFDVARALAGDRDNAPAEVFVGAANEPLLIVAETEFGVLEIVAMPGEAVAGPKP